MVRVFALVALFASAPVFAQEETLETTAATDPVDSAPKPSVQKYGADTNGPGFRAMRVGLELLGGGLTALAVATGYTLVSCAVDPADGWCVLGGVFIGSFWGAAVGAPLAIWGVGYLLDGTGSFWATIGGAALGTLAGVGLIMTNNYSAATAGVTLPFLFSVLAYELTSFHSRVDSEAASRTKWTITPSVGPKSAGLAFAMTF